MRTEPLFPANETPAAVTIETDDEYCASALRPGTPGDERENAGGADGGDGFANDIHEPADELPEDCRPDYEPENADGGRNKPKE